MPSVFDALLPASNYAHPSLGGGGGGNLQQGHNLAAQNQLGAIGCAHTSTFTTDQNDPNIYGWEAPGGRSFDVPDAYDMPEQPAKHIASMEPLANAITALHSQHRADGRPKLHIPNTEAPS